jgi:hypothetical protein
MPAVELGRSVQFRGGRLLLKWRNHHGISSINRFVLVLFGGGFGYYRGGYYDRGGGYGIGGGLGLVLVVLLIVWLARGGF